MRTATKKRWISTLVASFGMLFVVKVFGVWESNITNNDSVSTLDRNEHLLSPKFPIISSKVVSNHQSPSTPLFKRELYQMMSKQYDVHPRNNIPYKKILFWNDAVTLGDRENRNFGVGVGRDRYKVAGCPVWQCETTQWNPNTMTPENLLEFDAIIFNQRTWNGSNLPSVRSPKQRYIFFSHEPPLLPILFQTEEFFWETMKNFFNWTMTYRWDSDILHPYGWAEPLGSLPLHPERKVYEPFLKRDSNENYASGKTKMIVSFISNCDYITSGREKVMSQLMEHGIQLDQYGLCGNMTCNEGYPEERMLNEDEFCLKMASRKYKFYLSIHNSLCLDYVPERLFNAFRYSMIPIVIDTHRNHERIAPPHSFINVLDFPSVRHLADYLRKLDQNDNLYNQYFWWKRHYQLRSVNLYEGIHYKTHCGLCAALHDSSRSSQQKVYPDMKAWWKDGANCTSVDVDGVYTTRPACLNPGSHC